MIPHPRIHPGPTFGRVAGGDPASGGPYAFLAYIFLATLAGGPGKESAVFLA